jgi:hypothetical protein
MKNRADHRDRPAGSPFTISLRAIASRFMAEHANPLAEQANPEH